MVHIVEVKAVKETMPFDIIKLIASEASLRVAVEEKDDEVLRFGGDGVLFGEDQPCVQDEFVHRLDIFIIIWRASNQHLVDQNSVTPPVHRFSIRFASHDLGWEIRRRSGEACCTSVFVR